MRLENRQRVLLDLRWARIKGGFDPPRYLQRLKRKLKAQAELEPGLGPWNQAGKAALKKLNNKGLSAAGFCWQDKNNPAQGPGAVVFSHQSQRAALFFFHAPKGDNQSADWSDVLASYHDQSGLDWQDWAVFDFKAKLPGAFGLKRHSLRPGHYQLLFERSRAWLVLETLGPASVILQDADIASWARSFYRGGKDKPRLNFDPREFKFRGGPACEWDQKTWGLFGPGLPDWLPARIGQRLTRIWWPQNGHKLLVVRAGGAAPLDLEQFETVCEQYEAL